MELVYLIISFIGAIQGIILSTVLLFKRTANSSNIYLALFLIVFSAGLLENFLVQSSANPLMAAMFQLVRIANFIYGPLLYLYIRHLNDPDRKFELKESGHFIPFLCILVISLTDFGHSDLFDFICLELLVLQIVAYSVYTFLFILRNEKNLITNHPQLHLADITSFKIILALLLCSYLLSFLITHLILLGFSDMSGYYVYAQFLMAMVSYAFTFLILLNPGLFLKNNKLIRAQKYERSGLSSELAQQYHQQILAYFNKEKPFLNPDFTIVEMSDHLGVSKNHLSQVINDQMGSNFNQLINQYRIQAAQEMLINGALKNYTISAIGLQAGYNSKSTFNSNFKKFTGVTPSEWVKQPEKYVKK